mgnify:CR=1 FL=1
MIRSLARWRTADSGDARALPFVTVLRMLAMLTALTVVASCERGSAEIVDDTAHVSTAPARADPDDSDLHSTSWPRMARPRYPELIRALRRRRELRTDMGCLELLPVQDPVEAGVCVASIELALDQYDGDALRVAMAKVVIVTRIGASADDELVGLWHDGTVYVSTRFRGAPVDVREIGRTFHAELSSALLDQFGRGKFSTRWPGPLPDVMYYGESSLEAVRRGHTSRVPRHENFEAGFLHEYARTNRENDFNAVFVVLVSEPSRAATLGEQYPLLGEKFACAREILRCLGVQALAGTE